MAVLSLKEKLIAPFNFLRSQESPLVGVDISSSAIKMVEIEEAGKGLYRVERYAIEQLPKDAVVDGNIANLEQVSEAMKVAWKRLGTRVRNVALALPAAAVITKKVILPGGHRDEDLEFAVQGEANQYIPFTLDEVNLDFQVLGISPNSPDEVEVLIAASRKEKIEDRVAVTEAANLKTLIMDVESFATQAAFELIRGQLQGGGENAVYAIVISAVTTRMTMIHKDQSVYVREQQIGGNQLTQDIASHYGMTRRVGSLQAERSLPENHQTDILHPFIDKLANEIARGRCSFSIPQLSSTGSITSFVRWLRATDRARRADCQQTQTHTIIANPFSNMALAQRIKPRQLTQDAALMVACGLAMRRFRA
jgi:type IV pilus assembly protein PilM